MPWDNGGGGEETISRAAAKLEPHGYWPHHAVSHVFEMTGRPRDGLQWMVEREPMWSSELNVSRVHIWWHKALFHMELGDKDAARASANRRETVLGFVLGWPFDDF